MLDAPPCVIRQWTVELILAGEEEGSAVPSRIGATKTHSFPHLRWTMCEGDFQNLEPPVIKQTPVFVMMFQDRHYIVATAKNKQPHVFLTECLFGLVDYRASMWLCGPQGFPERKPENEEYSSLGNALAPSLYLGHLENTFQLENSITLNLPCLDPLWILSALWGWRTVSSRGLQLPWGYQACWANCWGDGAGGSRTTPNSSLGKMFFSKRGKLMEIIHDLQCSLIIVHF